jgi:aldehyde:ferredoxin oxidoreductase
MLKSAGYDHVVITGKAKKPSYLKIIDDDVEICDAGDLWGKKDVYETADELVNRHRGASGGCGVWTIGKAGENLVRWAHAFADKRGTLGRGGGGAVMGSKNLKAVVTLGTKGVRVADPKKFIAMSYEKREENKKHPLYYEIYPPKGGHTMVPVYPEGFFDEVKNVRVSCANCQGGEYWACALKDGRFAGQGMQSLIWIQIPLWSQRLKVKDGRDMLKFTDYVTRYGLCYPTTCHMIRWVVSLFERGIITTKDTGGLTLKLGDIDGYIKLLRKLVNKEDIGAVMAEGWYPLSNKYNTDADEDFDNGWPIVKGMDLIIDARNMSLTPATFGALVKPRVLQQHQATHNPRGEGEDLYKETCWPTSRKSFNDIKRNFQKMGTSEEEMNRIFTEKYFYQGRLEKHAEDAAAVYNSLGMCDISPYGVTPAPTQDIPWLSELYTAATGFPVSPSELKEMGERVINLEGIFNAREGIAKEDCEFPSLWIQNITTPFEINTPTPELGDVKGISYLHDWFGRRVNEDDCHAMLDEYYDEREWDVSKGIPTKEKLIKLGLHDYIQDSDIF